MTGFDASQYLCCICNSPIPLETSNTDESGNPVHEECYVRKTISKFREPKRDFWADVYSKIQWLEYRLPRR